MTPTPQARKKKLRAVYTRCRDKENRTLGNATPETIITGDESMRSYKRRRLMLNYEETPHQQETSSKSHSPDFSRVTWDKEAVLKALEEYPLDALPINW